MDIYHYKNTPRPHITYTGKKIIGMGKWDDGKKQAIEHAKKSKSERTWTTKHDRPVGCELYEEDPVIAIHGIGEKSEKILNDAGIIS